MSYLFHYQSPLGGITLGSDGDALTGLWFDGQQFFGATLEPDACEADIPVFDETVRWLDCYFKGKDPGFRPKLSLKATPFRRQIWEILMDIPFGQTMTYGEIGARIAENQKKRPTSARAVGGAVGHNPVSLIIPCHRVVGSDGSFTGYAGGIHKKIALLKLERADFSRLHF